MDRSKRDKTIAITSTLLVHALVLLVLCLMAFRTPLPLPGEEGVEVDLGMYNQGMGEVQPEKPALPQQAPETRPEQKVTSHSKEDIVTQNTEEVPAIKPQQTVNQKALFKGNNKKQEGGSEGITGQPGDQGNPNGLAGVKQYDGQGGHGNGVGYNLGGRGAKTLQRPGNDFDDEGTIVVDIWVDREGNVTQAEIGKGTEISNNKMRQMALEAARRSKFNSDHDAPELQKGTISYTFIKTE